MLFFSLVQCTYIKGKSSWNGGDSSGKEKEHLDIIQFNHRLRIDSSLVQHGFFCFRNREGMTGEKHAMVANLEKFPSETIPMYQMCLCRTQTVIVRTQIDVSFLSSFLFFCLFVLFLMIKGRHNMVKVLCIHRKMLNCAEKKQTYIEIIGPHINFRSYETALSQ